MANKLQAEWKKIKDPLENQVATFKKTKSGWNTEPLEKILKKMNLNFGDTLGKAADAFKAKKGDDVKKYCGKAVEIAEKYQGFLSTLPKNRGDGGIDYAAKLNPLIATLKKTEAGGATAANPF
jgi:hypothetical protein